jgi:sigma-B regulation protein RsbU (phosphoserine phosphatase)
MDYPLDPSLRVIGEKILVILGALGLTLLFWRLGKSGQKTIERQFLQQKYDLHRATGELAEIMATKVGMVQLAQGIIEKLAKVMELKRVGVMFFRNQRNSCCQEAYGFEGSEWDELCVLHGERLVDEIQRYRSESRFSIDYLPPSIKEEFIRNGFRHIIAIRFKDKLVGTFLIGEKSSEMPFDVEDLTFLGAVAKQASIAIENAFLHEELTERERMKHELAIARRIQMASLPQETPEIAGLDISGTSIPATEVGGDYFDYLNGVASALTVIVGDVSGKGTSAALYMSKVQGIIRSLHAFELSPRELFIRANQLLCKDMEKKSFITAIGAFIDTKERNLVLARAGHLPLFYYNARDKEVQLITPRGMGLGLENADVFATEMEEQVIPYQPGDIFLFVTDGITEAQTTNGGEFGEDKLSSVLEQSISYSANAIRDRVISEVNEFVADRLPHDDQTIVVVKTE